MTSNTILKDNELLRKIEIVKFGYPGNHFPTDQIFKHLTSCIDVCDESNWTTLHYAAYLGMEELVKLLLAKGADVNKVNNNKLTPLHLACCSANPSCIRVILSHNPLVNVQDESLNTPLNKLLQVTNKHPDIVKMFLKAGADPNIPDGKGCTPLHNVALNHFESRTEECMGLLISYNGDVNFKDSLGNTPLHLAIMFGSHQLVKLLLYCGARLNISNENGDTPMQMALCSRMRYPEIVQYVGTEYILRYTSKLERLERIEKLHKINDLKSFQLQCEKELLQLKTASFADSNVTYYDILMKPTYKIANYLDNSNIFETLIKFDAEKYKFGRYLSENIKSGLKRLEAMKIGYSLLSNLFPNIPYICMYYIVGHLTNANIYNLRKTFPEINIAQ